MTNGNNNVLIQAAINGCSAQYHSGLRLVRNNNTYLGVPTAEGSRTAATCGGFFNLNGDAVVTASISFIDYAPGPGTHAYKIQAICPQNTPVAINTSTTNSNSSYTLCTTSTLNLFEIST